MATSPTVVLYMSCHKVFAISLCIVYKDRAMGETVNESHSCRASANKAPCLIAGLMLGQSLRRWPIKLLNIKPAVSENLLSFGKNPCKKNVGSVWQNNNTPGLTENMRQFHFALLGSRYVMYCSSSYM